MDAKKPNIAGVAVHKRLRPLPAAEDTDTVACRDGLRLSPVSCVQPAAIMRTLPLDGFDHPATSQVVTPDTADMNGSSSKPIKITAVMVYDPRVVASVIWTLAMSPGSAMPVVPTSVVGHSARSAWRGLSRQQIRQLIMRYRADIDGLRALAVVPVLLFRCRVAVRSGRVRRG